MDPKATAINGLKGACYVFLRDLQALPDDAYSKCFGPATRTVADIVYEVNLVNKDVLKVIGGESPADWPEGWIKAPEDFQTKEVVVDAFEKSSERILATVEALSAEVLESTFQTEHGERTPGSSNASSWPCTFGITAGS